MFIGIDPGNTGALAALYPSGTVEVHDMPTMANGKKQQVNAAAVAEILSEWSRRGSLVVVEKVAAMPGQGVTSMFNFGMGYGVIQGVVAATGLPMRLVTPQSWKKPFGLIGKDKDMARTIAQQLYPNESLSRKKDIGRADAILIATYGQAIASTND